MSIGAAVGIVDLENPPSRRTRRTQNPRFVVGASTVVAVATYRYTLCFRRKEDCRKSTSVQESFLGPVGRVSSELR